MIRIAYCGCDYFANCFAALAQRDDVKVIKLYACGGKAHSGEILRTAKEHGIPYRFKPLDQKEVERLFGKLNCDYVLSAGYSFKIPIGSHRGLNIHPTLLPIGRGAWPFPRILLDGYTESGVTIHKLTDRFDAGDIVLQQSFPLDAQETQSTLHSKGQMLALKLLKEWLEKPGMLWEQATPQGEGKYWKQLTPKDRVIDFDSAPNEINRMVRAFGSDGVYIKADDRYWLSDSVVCQECDHAYEIGTVLNRNRGIPPYNSLCVAVNHGILFATNVKEVGKKGFLIRAKRKIKKLLRLK